MVREKISKTCCISAYIFCGEQNVIVCKQLCISKDTAYKFHTEQNVIACKQLGIWYLQRYIRFRKKKSCM